MSKKKTTGGRCNRLEAITDVAVHLVDREALRTRQAVPQAEAEVADFRVHTELHRKGGAVTHFARRGRFAEPGVGHAGFHVAGTQRRHQPQIKHRLHETVRELDVLRDLDAHRNCRVVLLLRLSGDDGVAVRILHVVTVDVEAVDAHTGVRSYQRTVVHLEGALGAHPEGRYVGFEGAVQRRDAVRLFHVALQPRVVEVGEERDAADVRNGVETTAVEVEVVLRRHQPAHGIRVALTAGEGCTDAERVVHGHIAAETYPIEVGIEPVGVVTGIEVPGAVLVVERIHPQGTGFAVVGRNARGRGRSKARTFFDLRRHHVGRKLRVLRSTAQHCEAGRRGESLTDTISRVIEVNAVLVGDGVIEHLRDKAVAVLAVFVKAAALILILVALILDEIRQVLVHLAGNGIGDRGVEGGVENAVVLQGQRVQGVLRYRLRTVGFRYVAYTKLSGIKETEVLGVCRFSITGDDKRVAISDVHSPVTSLGDNVSLYSQSTVCCTVTFAGVG